MEDAGLIGQLGINWKLFLSQAVNFFILLFILRAFVYKPLLAVMKKRTDKIKEGLEKAAIADTRLKEVDVIAKNRLKKADAKSMDIIKATEDKAKKLDMALQMKAEEKHEETLKQIQVHYLKQQEEVKKQVSKEAAELIKKFIVKTVELNPKAIDEALIDKAISQAGKES